MTVEVIGRLCNGAFHHLPPAVFVVIEFRNDQIFQFVIEILDLAVSPLISSYECRGMGTDGPAVDALYASLYPSAVQNAEVDNSVAGSLHPAGARGFHGRQGRVQPHVYAGNHLCC